MGEVHPMHVLPSKSGRESPGPRRDFTVADSESELKYVAEVFQNKYKTQVRGILGPDLHDTKAITILNRIVAWTDARIEYQANPMCI